MMMVKPLRYVCAVIALLSTTAPGVMGTDRRSTTRTATTILKELTDVLEENGDALRNVDFDVFIKPFRLMRTERERRLKEDRQKEREARRRKRKERVEEQRQLEAEKRRIAEEKEKREYPGKCRAITKMGPVSRQKITTVEEAKNFLDLQIPMKDGISYESMKTIWEFAGEPAYYSVFGFSREQMKGLLDEISRRKIQDVNPLGAQGIVDYEDIIREADGIRESLLLLEKCLLRKFEVRDYLTLVRCIDKQDTLIEDLKDDFRKVRRVCKAYCRVIKKNTCYLTPCTNIPHERYRLYEREEHDESVTPIMKVVHKFMMDLYEAGELNPEVLHAIDECTPAYWNADDGKAIKELYKYFGCFVF